MIGEEQEKLDPGHRHFQDDYPASAQTWPQACSISEKPFLDAMELEPIFVCLAKIVQNFVEENTRIGKPNMAATAAGSIPYIMFLNITVND
ncbi:hypothetical protein YC2023_115434 [Brassica napus]